MSTNFDDMDVDNIYTIEGAPAPSFYSMSFEEYYNDFINNIIGFIDDIQITSFNDTIIKNNRLLYFGFILIILSIVLIPVLVNG